VIEIYASFCVNHYSTVKKINEEWYGGTVPEPRGTMGVSIAASAARNWRSSANQGTNFANPPPPPPPQLFSRLFYLLLHSRPFFPAIVGQKGIEDLKNRFPLVVSISFSLA
jgi:hypothetical protein